MKILSITIGFLLCFFAFLQAEVKVSYLGGKLSFELVSSTSTDIRIVKGGSVILSTVTIVNNGEEPFDVSLKITHNTPLKVKESFTGDINEIIFYGIFSNKLPEKNDFGLEDTISEENKSSFIDTFAVNTGNKEDKGYDVSPKSTRKMFFRIDVSSNVGSSLMQKEYSFYVNLTVMSSIRTNQTTVGVNGGKLEIPNRISLTIPLGALKESTELSIQKFTSSLPDSPVGVYEILPKGTIFRRPCQLSISYKDTSISESEDKLKIFYWDGYDWRHIGGEVDKTKKIVTCNIIHLSVFAILLMQKSPPIRPLEKIITPATNDGINDVANFDILAGRDAEIKIFDIAGNKVKTINVLIEGNIWDGKDEFGNLVESGIYIYQYETEIDGIRKRVSGTIAVAK